MKKLLICLFIFAGCKSAEQKNMEHVDSIIAELKTKTEELKNQRKVDSEMNATFRNALFDTLGVANAPVKILESRLIKKEYSSYKSIYLRYSNTSDRKITAIRFKWYGINAFNEPADMGEQSNLAGGFGGGFTDEILSPGNSSSGTWDILSRDGKRIICAWPSEVVFADGSKWTSKSK